MKPTYKKALRIAIIALSVILLLTVGLYLFRKPILRKGITKAAEKIEARTGMTLTVNNIDLNGLNLIRMDSVRVMEKDDTVFTADKMFMRIRMANVLFGKIRPEEFIMNNARLYYARQEAVSPILADSLESEEVTEPSDTTGKTADSIEKILSLDYKSYVDQSFDAIFDYVPDRITVDSMTVLLSRNEKKGRIFIENLQKEGAPYQMELSLYDEKSLQTYAIKGEMNSENKSLSMQVTLLRGDNEIPLVDKIFDIKASLIQLDAFLQQKDRENDRTIIKSSLHLEGFSILHPDISVERVELESIDSDMEIAFGDQFLQIDSSSQIKINRIDIPFYFSYGRYGDRTFTVTIPETKWRAEDFFSSLPPGLFNTFQGLEATGIIKYSLYAQVNPKKPEELKFDSSMDSENLKITKYGREDYRKINSKFIQKAYVKEKLDRTFTVSPGSDSYVTLDEVSPYLINSLLTAEDGGFWSHNGFNEEAFRDSFITNLKDSNFTRGGSTITMQLVKNVYLSKRKTIGRKVEEALIVWLIEELDLVSKRQLLQTYLNIIEWGPHVYGIQEASDFYFGKHPSDLTLAESLFLTSIIPKPRKARSSFDYETGQLRAYHSHYFNLLTGIMLRRNQLEEKDTTGLKAEIYLTDNAYNRLNLPKPEPPEEEEQGIFNKLFSSDNAPVPSGF
ncbi:transglycosylase domain-containing protein [Roseivirga sp. BDSF3-8]|uniref:transglycosylase domain-containing protein n=1 Tax=Roseivirga sp. BDSF3-8 TaxID=3241598 RepID=UPI003531AA5C